MARIKTIVALLGMTTWIMALTVGLAYANEAEKGQQIVDDMTQVFDHLNADPDMGWFRSNLKRAQGVLLRVDDGKAVAAGGGYVGSRAEGASGRERAGIERRIFGDDGDVSGAAIWGTGVIARAGAVVAFLRHGVAESVGAEEAGWVRRASV